MSLVLPDGVKETTTTTGTGTLSLAGATTGLRTFVAGVGNGNTCAYRVDDGLGNWEETWGTVTSGTPDTLTRGTLITSSTGSRITFAAGTKTVAVVPMVELLLTPAASAGLAETSIASATTTDLGTVQTFRALITGTVTITSFGTQPNAIRWVRFASSLTLTYNASSLILLSGATRVVSSAAIGCYMSDGSGNWREIYYRDFDLVVTGAAGATNYSLDVVSAYQKSLLFLSWNAGSGYALCIFDSATTPQLISSSNAAGGNSCFDVTNSTASNGGNGIALIVTGGNATIQTKTNYTGGAVRVTRLAS